MQTTALFNAGPCTHTQSHMYAHPPPRKELSVGPNFSHHKARVQAVGWFPLGTRNRGADLLLPLPPPNRNGARLKAGPSPPQHALAPTLRADTW